MRLREAERAWREALFRGGRLEGVEPEREALYRRLVVANLAAPVEKAAPLARALLGEEPFRALVTSWLAGAPPTTRTYRDLPLAFAAWLAARPATGHAALAELVHWETLEVEVLGAPDPEGPPPPDEPALDARVESDPSARLAAYRHPVHRLDPAAPAWPALAAEPVLLLAHRVDEARRVVELSPGAARLLAACAAGVTVGEALGQVGGASAPALALLRDLRARGALRGFPRR